MLRVSALPAILALAAVLRFWGLGFGLPDVHARPDEASIAGTALNYGRAGTLQPRAFNYPSLFSYVVGGAYVAGCAGATAVGASSSLAGCLDALAGRWDYLLFTSRALSALAGIAGVAAVYFIARRLHPSAGWPSAAMLAVAFLHVRDSHFGVTDVAMTSMLLFALLLLLRADEHPTPGRFALAGFVAGLAASTKYNAILLAAAAVASQVRAWIDTAAPRGATHTRLIVFGAAAALGFIAGTPYALITTAQFVRDATYEAAHLMQGHAVALEVGWKYHALLTLPQGVGWLLFAGGVAGMVWMVVKNPRVAVLVFSFPVVYYAVAGRGQTVFVRYMIPVVPFLCLGAGAMIAAAADSVARRNTRLAFITAIALVCICAGPTAAKSVQFDRVVSRTDSRALAANWVERRIEPGASILMTGGGFPLSRDGKPLPYDVWMVEPYGDSSRVIGPAGQRPDWIVVEESPLRRYSYFPEALAPVLHEYVLIYTIRAVNPAPGMVYDQQDAFYLPLNHFAHVTRPGPNFLFYERRELRAGESRMIQSPVSTRQSTVD
jgi:Dolichyl-phosphate-mannose-protein mannosyltransferase